MIPAVDIDNMDVKLDTNNFKVSLEVKHIPDIVVNGIIGFFQKTIAKQIESQI